MKCKPGYARIKGKCKRVSRDMMGYSNSWNVNCGGGVSFMSLLVLLFIGLKLTGNIAWSWWWVFSPLWISFSLSLLIFLIFMLFVGVFRK